MSEEILSVVIDNGTFSCKSGYAGSTIPASIIRTIIGRSYSNINEIYIGNNLFNEDLNSLNLSYPIERGTIINWDDMEKIWTEIYNNLNIPSNQYSVILTNSISNEEEDEEKILEIFFEKYNASKICVAYQPLLSLYANGVTTGTSIEFGDGIIQIIPIINNNIIQIGKKFINFGGHDITTYLYNLIGLNSLIEEGSFKKEEIVRNIKENYCYVTINYTQELIKSLTTNDCKINYILPNNQTITLNSERFQSTECLFNPLINGSTHQSLQQVVYDSITSCDSNVQNILFNNIFLSGSSTKLPGLSDRLKNEIINLAPEGTNVNIYSVSNSLRGYEAWLGGAQIAANEENFITRNEYEENGAEVIHLNQ